MSPSKIPKIEEHTLPLGACLRRSLLVGRYNMYNHTWNRVPEPFSENGVPAALHDEPVILR